MRKTVLLIIVTIGLSSCVGVEVPEFKTDEETFKNKVSQNINKLDSLTISGGYTAKANLNGTSKTQSISFTLFLSPEITPDTVFYQNAKKEFLKTAQEEITNLDKFDQYHIEFSKNGKIVKEYKPPFETENGSKDQ